MAESFTILITGLPSSGKTTTAKLLAERLKESSNKIEILDGDQIRKNLSSDLGFSREDRFKHAERLSFIAKLLNRNGVVVLIPIIAPYQEMRSRLKDEIENYIEVYLKCSLEVCEQRDLKGLYSKARRGEIKEFTGISSPYEEPVKPDIICAADKDSAELCVSKIINKLESLKIIAQKSNVYSKEEEEQIKNQLKNLGYF